MEEYDLESRKKKKYKIVLDEESEMKACDYTSLSNFVDADKLGSYFDIQDGVLTRYVGKDTDLIIPEGVTEVSGDLFWSEKEFETIVIPSTLVKISGSIFARCKTIISHIHIFANAYGTMLTKSLRLQNIIFIGVFVEIFIFV